MIFRVVEGAGGKPIKGAVVTAPHAEPRQEHATNGEGVCRIAMPEPRPEQLGVFVWKGGFVPLCVVWDLSREASSLPAEFTLSLEQGSAIGGRVVDEEGRPIEGVTAFLNLWTVVQNGNPQVRPDILNRTALTDREGRWHFDEAPANLDSLIYRLKHPHFIEELNFSRADVPTERFRDGSLAWVMKRGIPLQGVVTDREGGPLAGAEVLPGRSRVSSGTKPAFFTDAAGEFLIRCAPGESISLTVRAAGHGPSLVSFAAMEGMAPIRVVMEPSRMLRGRVVDEGERPIAGALVFADTWRQHRTLEWHTQTDAEGRFAWPDAPSDEVLFDIMRSGFRAVRRKSLTASEEEQTIVLPKPTRIHGTVRDAATDAPLESFRVIPGRKEQNGRIYWLRERGMDFAGGAFEWPLTADVDGGNGRAWLLHIEARGYLSAVWQIRSAGEAQALDFQLRPGPPTGGRVLKPDGEPADDASVAVVFGNPASVEGGSLKAGDGNMALCTSPEGEFAFPPQEPPYAIVAVHPAGCAVAMAEEFAANPILRLQSWGRLEITADGASPAGGSIPFSIVYRDLPKDEQKILWVFFRSEPKRISGNRIVFEKLLPGKAWVRRNRQSNRDGVNILIEGGRTTTLDFDRGVGTGGESVPGIVAVKVVDEAGSPVEGATVVSTGFKLKSRPGARIRKEGSISPAPERLTNSHGIAMVRNPMHFREDEVEAISLRVRHPEFCTAQSEVPIAGEALPVVLKRGGTVKVSGFLETNGRTANRVYPEVLSPEHGSEVDRDGWLIEEGGILVNRQILPGRHCLRLVSFPEEDRAHFSEVVEVNVKAGEVRDLRLALKPGLRAAGRFDESVPRPVSNGFAYADVLSRAADADGLMQWYTTTEVRPDGSFVFDALPSGVLELHGICEGFVSRNPPGSEPRLGRFPQTFTGQAEAIVLEMELAAAVRIEIKDQDGAPTAGARVHFSPNIISASRGSRLFASPGLKTEDVLRMPSDARKQAVYQHEMAIKFHGITDESGVATISNLPPGKMRFWAHREGYEMEIAATERMMPGIREIELSPGEVRTLSIIMRENSGK